MGMGRLTTSVLLVIPVHSNERRRLFSIPLTTIVSPGNSWAQNFRDVCKYTSVDWPFLEYQTHPSAFTCNDNNHHKKAQLIQIRNKLDPVNQKSPPDLRPIILITQGVNQFFYGFGHQLHVVTQPIKMGHVGPEKKWVHLVLTLYRRESIKMGPIWKPSKPYTFVINLTKPSTFVNSRFRILLIFYWFYMFSLDGTCLWEGVQWFLHIIPWFLLISVGFWRIT